MSIFQTMPDDSKDGELVGQLPDGRHVAIFPKSGGGVQLSVSDNEVVLPMWVQRYDYPDREAAEEAARDWLNVRGGEGQPAGFTSYATV